MSIYKRGGTYWYSFVFSGRRVQRSTKVKNANDARDIERAAWNQLARGEVGLPGERKNTTFGELMDALEARDTEDGAISSQRKSLLKQARSAFGSKIAAKVTTEDAERYIATQREKGKKPATINRVGEIVRRAYRLAKLMPPDFRHLSEAGNTRQGFLEPSEFARLLEFLPADLKDFCTFAFTTGWRKNEIASLRWSDVEGDVVRLRPEHAKNGEARSVVLTGTLAQVIERRRQVRVVRGALTHLVFHRNSLPIAEFRKAWKGACAKAGIAGRLFHDLRRSAVRNMVRSGVPQSVAMKISGHRTTSMFHRYDIASEDDLRQAMQAVERYHEETKQKVVAITGQ